MPDDLYLTLRRRALGIVKAEAWLSHGKKQTENNSCSENHKKVSVMSVPVTPCKVYIFVSKLVRVFGHH